MKQATRATIRFLLGLLLLTASGIMLQSIPALPLRFDRSSVGMPIGAGFLAGLTAFGLVSRFTPFYVLGHELTHWFTAKLFGRRTGRFRISMASGSVAVERPNVWIVLAPYFVPIYTLAWIGTYGLVRCLYGPVSPAMLKGVWAGIGLTYAFHVILTIHSLRGGQTDLHYQGRFLSLSLILFCNVLLVFLAITAAGRTWASSFRLLSQTFHGHASLLASLLTKLRP